MYNTKALALVPNIPQCLILFARCKNFSPILLIHINDVKTKPRYKTNLTVKTPKLLLWLLIIWETLFTNFNTRACPHAQVLVWFSYEDAAL